MLPAILSNEKKRNKVKNLLMEMRMKDKSLCCQTTNGTSLWDIESNAVAFCWFTVGGIHTL